MGKPFGHRAEAPRQGSRAEAILRAFQNCKPVSARGLTEFLNLQSAFGAGTVASQSTVLNVLKRWAPGWRGVMERNKYEIEQNGLP